ncbi:periphilin-1 isoform X1 [Xiphophorus couchianus]|uniref:periphilin-1 isoform X1 n=1 Tax=Xiphophorus couchianus TaxID=32473 RepID=UPI0010169001|nr:periphilin-1-like isoform X1 [Xiphophorus couchianus]
MAYQHGRKSIREAYEERFTTTDAREVIVHRVVNIIDKRNPMPRPGLEFDRGYEDQRYGGPRNYQSGRGYHSEDGYQPDDSQYYDENLNYGSYRRNSPPHRNEGSYSQQSYSRDDLRHQLSSRNRSRGHNLPKRGRGSGPPPSREDYEDYRSSKSLVITRERSPGRREGHPPVRSGSNTNRSSSPDRDKGYTYQQKHKSNTTKSYTPSSSVEGSPHRSLSAKEKPSASAAETEEVAAASTEPKLMPEEDLKARRSEAIKAKVAEIEKNYRQDCETFCTVVKMLVDKEPSLDGLLQAPLDKNLSEIRQHCLDAIKSFMVELDEILAQPDTTA